MKVRCVSDYPSPELIQKLGPGFYRDQAFHLTVGMEYLVLGMEFEVQSKLFGTCACIELRSDYGHLITTPIGLFDIVDARASRHWEARMWEDGSVTLWPPSFYQEHYHDNLSERTPEVVADFKRVYALLDLEATEGGDQNT